MQRLLRLQFLYIYFDPRIVVNINSSALPSIYNTSFFFFHVVFFLGSIHSHLKLFFNLFFILFHSLSLKKPSCILPIVPFSLFFYLCLLAVPKKLFKCLVKLGFKFYEYGMPPTNQSVLYGLDYKVLRRFLVLPRTGGAKETSMGARTSPCMGETFVRFNRKFMNNVCARISSSRRV